MLLLEQCNFGFMQRIQLRNLSTWGIHFLKVICRVICNSYLRLFEEMVSERNTMTMHGSNIHILIILITWFGVKRGYSHVDISKPICHLI